MMIISIKNILQSCLAAFLFGMLISPPILVQAATKEEAVKAAFVYNFTKFIVWPAIAGTDDNFNLCVVGDDKLGGSLEAIYGKLVGNKPLVLRRNLKGEDFKGCQMAFIAADEDRSMQEMLQEFNGLPVVTVSDSPDFVKNGGMIGLIRVGNRVGFEVNLVAVNAAGLHFGAQLLKLAKNVKGLK